MKAQPLVYKRTKTDTSPSSTTAVSDKHRSKFPFVSYVKKRLQKSNVNLQVNFDILTKSALKQTIANGSKMLHITSDVVKEDALVVEREHGICESIKTKQLSDMIENIGVNRIELISVAIPKSVSIGEVFRRKGTKHVLCFDSVAETRKMGEDELDDLIQPRLNLVFIFCTEFYGLLVDGLSVKEAFKEAKLYLTTHREQIWESKHPPLTNDALNIIPVLLEEEHVRHEEKLNLGVPEQSNRLSLRYYEERLSADKEQKFEVCDTSKMRG